MRKLFRTLTYFLVIFIPLVFCANIDSLNVKFLPDGQRIQARLNTLDILLKKPSRGESVLAKDVVVLTADVDESGKTVYDRWMPTLEEQRASENLYIDHKTRSILRPSSENELWSGLVNGNVVRESIMVRDQLNTGRADYIDLGRNVTLGTTSTARQSTRAVNAVVEVVIVLDKEFGDIFGHNRQAILDYITVYMWDVNIRYKTLTSDNVSWRVNGVVIISSPAAQPFIENSRGPDGRVEFGRILNLDEYRYPKWVYDQINSWPRFDLAPLMTNAAVEWGGGLAYMRAACWVDNGARRHIGVSVWNDNGAWGSLTVGAHELGHNMGAPHDDDQNFPGGCSERGYIMGGGNDDLRWMFSSCSDRTISEFVRSSGASCLQSLDGSPILDPEFNAVQAPSMETQCKRQLNDPNSWIDWAAGGTTCKSIRCLTRDSGGTIWIHRRTPVDNSPCETGNNRCFRGRCRPQGYLIKNVGSGLCARASNSNEFTAPFEMVQCPRTGTPLDRFVMAAQSSGGITLSTPFTKGPENGDKCAYTGGSDGDAIWTDRCGDNTNQWHRWDWVDVGNSQFQLRHRTTGRCAKPTNRNVGSGVQTFACNTNDVDMKWTRQL